MRRFADLTLVCVTVLVAIAMLRGGDPVELVAAESGQNETTPPAQKPTKPPSAQPAAANDEKDTPPRSLAEDLSRLTLIGDAAPPPLGEASIGKAPPPGLGEQIPWGLQVRRPAAAAVEITPDMIKTCLEVAFDVDPNLASKLRSLQSSNPAEFRRRLTASRRLIGLAELRSRDPSLYQLKIIGLRVDAEVSRLARELQDARRDGLVTEAADIESKLRMQVTLQIAMAHNNRKEYLCRLQDLVAQLEAELAEEIKPGNMDRMVEHRMRRYLDKSPSGTAVPVRATGER